MPSKIKKCLPNELSINTMDHFNYSKDLSCVSSVVLLDTLMVKQLYWGVGGGTTSKERSWKHTAVKTGLVLFAVKHMTVLFICCFCCCVVILLRKKNMLIIKSYKTIALVWMVWKYVSHTVFNVIYRMGSRLELNQWRNSEGKGGLTSLSQ